MLLSIHFLYFRPQLLPRSKKSPVSKPFKILHFKQSLICWKRIGLTIFTNLFLQNFRNIPSIFKSMKPYYNKNFIEVYNCHLLSFLNPKEAEKTWSLSQSLLLRRATEISSFCMQKSTGFLDCCCNSSNISQKTIQPLFWVPAGTIILILAPLLVKRNLNTNQTYYTFLWTLKSPLSPLNWLTNLPFKGLFQSWAKYCSNQCKKKKKKKK